VAEELEAAVAARKELGAELEPQVIDSFVDRIERTIEARVDARLERTDVDDHDSRNAIGVALGSLGIGIPLTGAAGGTTGLAGIIVVWIGIVLVNYAYFLGRFRR
jgi:hypothetical protein